MGNPEWFEVGFVKAIGFLIQTGKYNGALCVRINILFFQITFNAYYDPLAGQKEFIVWNNCMWE